MATGRKDLTPKPERRGKMAPLTPEQRKQVDEQWEQAAPAEDVIARHRAERGSEQ
jgi:hypothetical protein